MLHGDMGTVVKATTERTSKAAAAKAKHGTETLEEIGKRLRRCLNDGDQAHLRVGVEVTQLADRWDEYRDTEAEGMEADKWLRKYVDPTRTLAWYRDHAKASKWIQPTGLHGRLASNLVVWMFHKMNDEDRDASAKALDKAWRKNGQMPLKLTQGRLLLARFTVRGKSKQRHTERIRELEARIARLEVQVRAGCKAGTEPVE